MTEIIPGYFVHTPDEKFGPYANIMEADTAAEKLMSEGVQVLGITKEGFEGVVSYEALEYSAESFTSAAVTTRSLGSAEKYECPTCKIVWYDTHTDHDFDTAGNPLCPLCAHAGYVSDAESFGAEGWSKMKGSTIRKRLLTAAKRTDTSPDIWFSWLGLEDLFEQAGYKQIPQRGLAFHEALTSLINDGFMESSTASGEVMFRFLKWESGLDERKAAESFSADVEMIECGNCDETFTIDEGLDIGGIDYCEECYDTISANDHPFDAESFSAEKELKAFNVLPGIWICNECGAHYGRKEEAENCFDRVCPKAKQFTGGRQGESVYQSFMRKHGHSMRRQGYDAHQAESKLPPVEKAGITGVASGATMEGLETLLATEDIKGECEGCGAVTWLDQGGVACDDCQYCEYCEQYHTSEVKDICYEEAFSKHYEGPAEDGDSFSAEGDLAETQEELAEVRTELSKTRTGMSFFRTGLALAGFILLWEHHKWAKEEHEIKENAE